MEEARLAHPGRSVAVLVVLAFLGGAAGGAFVGARVSRAFADAPVQRAHGPGRVDRMIRELKLDADAEHAVRAVFEKRRPEIRAVFERVKPEMDRLRSEMRAEMRAVLPPEKQPAFDRLIAEEEAREREHARECDRAGEPHAPPPARPR